MRSESRFITILVIALTLGVGACATSDTASIARQNRLDSIKESGALAANRGIVVVSAGRKAKGLSKEDGTNWAGILPFVSYHIFRLEAGQEPVEVAFLPAENGMFNQIGDQDYGFVHFRELPSGSYLAIGDESRGRDVFLAGGGYLMSLGPGSRSTDIAFQFDVEPGVVNYLGEWVTINADLKNSSVRISDEFDRDLVLVAKKYAEVKGYPARRITLAPVDPDSLDDLADGAGENGT